MTIAEVLSRWPETGELFQAHRMACVGCAIGPFCTVAEAATAYDMSPDELLAELEQTIDAAEIECPANDL